MPELPEVETIRRALHESLCGAFFQRVEVLAPCLREPLLASALQACAHGRLLGVRRRAKYLLLDFPARRCLLAHLGMTGSFRVLSVKEPLVTHDHAVFFLSGGKRLVYNDPRRFGLLRACVLEYGQSYPDDLAALGPEPLEPAFRAAYLYERLRRCKGPVKPFLMKQEVVVGVGNIYASESLFRSRISPQRPGKDLTRAECALLVRTIRAVLAESIAQGGTTISDYRQPDGSEGKFALRLRVYGRDGESCVRGGCPGVVQRTVQGGRSTFFCPRCQH